MDRRSGHFAKKDLKIANKHMENYHHCCHRKRTLRGATEQLRLKCCQHHMCTDAGQELPHCEQDCKMARPPLENSLPVSYKVKHPLYHVTQQFQSQVLTLEKCNHKSKQRLVVNKVPKCLIHSSQTLDAAPNTADR